MLPTVADVHELWARGMLSTRFVTILINMIKKLVIHMYDKSIKSAHHGV